MYTVKRPVKRPAFFIFIVASLVLAACGTAVANSNWPGLTAKDNRVYVAYGQQVLAVDIIEQEEVWAYPAEVAAQPLYFSAPSVEGDDVVFGDYGQSGGFISASVTVGIYSRQNTDAGVPPENWTNMTDATDRIIAPPLQVGETVFVGTADNKMLAFKADSGRPIWGEPFEAGHAIWGQPTYDDGVLFVPSMDGALTALDADSGETIWAQLFEGAVAAKPINGQGVVYISSYDKHVHALDKGSGEIVWSAPAEDAVWGGPALSDGIIYFIDLSGHLFAVDAETGSELWTVDTGRLTQATPVIEDGVIYLATVGNVGTKGDEWLGSLIAISAEDGSEIWSESTPVPLYSTPVIVQNTIVVALQSEEALLLVYDLEDGSILWRFVPEAGAEE